MKKIIIFSLIFLILFSNVIYGASDPKLIKTINNGLTKIKDWIIKISTPAAAVAIGTGVLMKKFSFGDEDRIVTGKRLIKSTLFSYTFILCIDLVLSLIQSLANA